MSARSARAIALVLSSIAGCGIHANVREPDGRTHWGPVHGPAAAAVRRFAREIPCPRNLTVETLTAGAQRVRGCGVTRMYACDERTCEPYARADGGVAPMRRPHDVSVPADGPTWTDEDVSALLDRVHDRAAACLPPGTDIAHLQVLVGADGSVRRIGAQLVSAETSACVDAVLAEAAIGREVTSARSVMIELRPSAIRSGADQVDAGTPDPTVP